MRLLVSRHLENFISLYAAKNMHVAAEAKGISQPALTKSLKLLEDELGTELFVRTHRGVEPTPAGHLLHRYASTIDQQARIAGMDLSDISNQIGGSLRIGVGPVLAASIFPSTIVEFHKRFPAINVTVETGISSSLTEGLVNNAYDLIVTARPEEPLGDDYHVQALFGSDMIVICREGHTLQSKETVSVSQLSGFERVGFAEDREFEKKSRRVFGAHTEAFRSQIETTSLAVMFGILSATDYYAIVSHILLPRAERDGLRPVKLDQSLWPIDVEMMCRRSLSLSRPIASLRTLLIEQVN